jgi:hypothetical protein
MDKVNALREIKQLRQVCSEAYQAVGMLGGLIPDKQLHKALENLSAAKRGDPIPHKTFLPLTMKGEIGK